MAAPVFGDDWMSLDDEEYVEAYAQFKAAVSTARMSSDEGIKQVLVLLFYFPLYVCIRLDFMDFLD